MECTWKVVASLVFGVPLGLIIIYAFLSIDGEPSPITDEDKADFEENQNATQQE